MVNSMCCTVKSVIASKWPEDSETLSKSCETKHVIENACPVWRSRLAVEHSDHLETIQRRALYLISGSSYYKKAMRFILYLTHQC
jgi:hypothetical protein